MEETGLKRSKRIARNTANATETGIRTVINGIYVVVRQGGEWVRRVDPWQVKFENSHSRRSLR